MTRQPMWRSTRCFLGLAVLATVAAAPAWAAPARRNIVFVLVDDMRFDAMSCMGHPFLETPAIDSLAQAGVLFRNAFVTTSLCSPSRASFLTGLYAHNHNILNNHTRLDPAIPTFSRLLQARGYQTAFVGKWHMGGSSDEPRPGWHYWASFRGQGNFFANDFNINGRHVHTEEYVTDTITRLSLDWIRQNADKPFMLYMSHKAVHGLYNPAPRHADRYKDVTPVFPASMEDTPENYFRKPNWVRAQRDSWHGVDDMYFKKMSLHDVVMDYNRCMLAIDESVAALTTLLKELDLYESTLIILAGDNGHMFGEHGLIDKRCMYEESIRIPMVMSCPELYGTAGKSVDKMVLNMDVAPTVLAAAGADIPESMQGRSFLELPNKPEMDWRTSFLYEYFWEAPYPETPTCIGIRTDRHKYITYHGIWDTNELYDVQKDPREMHNHISTSKRKKVTVDPEYREVYQDLKAQLRQLLRETGARELPTWQQ